MRYIGMCAKKIGLTNIVYENKLSYGTCLWIEKTYVLAHKTIEKDGYIAMLLGTNFKKSCKHINKPQHKLLCVNEMYATNIQEFRVHNKEELLPIGSEINPTSMFSINETVDVSGKTIGRGFSGGMVVHNFSGLGASHGVTKAHRSIGSTGGSRTQGKTRKGKKMAKRYGNENVTIKNLKIIYLKDLEIENKKGTMITVHGAVPGKAISDCIIYKK